MFNSSNNSGHMQNHKTQIDLELLEALLETEDTTYPWDPTADESEEYFLQLEEHFAMQDVLEEELSSRSRAFYNNLDNLWSHYKDTTSLNLVAQVQEKLQAMFAQKVPQDFLKSIAQKAVEIFDTQQTLGEQMIDCVQSLLPDWNESELLILARRFEVVKSSTEKAPINTVDNEWTELSEIEKAKVSLAVASYALSQVNSFQSQI